MTRRLRAEWAGPGGRLAEVVKQQSDENLRVYATSAMRVDEDAGQEMNLAHGGYGKRQLLELVQNGADAMIAAPGGRIQVVLTAEYLYCANEGEPINEDGIKALLHAHISRKREAEIGRFGLGFKSVLGVTDRPEFYCREVSFGFDGEWARGQISEVAPGRERYPSLRLARLLDPEEAGAADPLLWALMAEATTVVRLPRSLGQSEWLTEDIQRFESAFMLFSPHVGELLLSDRTTGLRREVRLKAEGNDVTVSEDGDARRWRIFRSSIRPSDEAKREAWELSARDELPVVWAVPIEGRLSVGRFWAFFPLRDETTLTGIANAPWQINDDRTGLLEASRLNKELLEELSELVLRSLSALGREDDPGWLLDVVPARGREARCWGDDYLTEQFYARAINRPVIPNQRGTLMPAADLKLPPGEASGDALELWAAASRRPDDWCHTTSVNTTTRRSRVERLFHNVNRREESVSTWLEVLLSAENPRVDDASHAVLTAAAFIGDAGADGASRRRTLIQRSRILLDAGGRLTEAKPAEIFMPRSGYPASTVVRVVHHDLVERPGVRDALRIIGLEEVTPPLELKAFIRNGIRAEPAQGWDVLWSLVRGVADVDEAITVLRSGFHGRPLSVLTIGGNYRPLPQTLLPGSVVPADGSRDAEFCIDTNFHGPELEVLRLLGAEPAPTAGYPTSEDDLVRSYLNGCISQYIRALPADSSTPARDYMRFDREIHVGPLEPLRHLSDEGRAAFTEELVRGNHDWGPWTLKHATQRIYPPRAFPSAYVWAVQREGRFRTSRGLVAPTKAWGRCFERWADIAPVASLSDDETCRFGVATTIDEIAESQWLDAFRSASESTDDGILGSFYALASNAAVAAPDALRCRIGSGHEERPCAEVVVTHDRAAFTALRGLKHPSLLVSSPEEARVLVENWSLEPDSAHVHQQMHWVEAGSASSLADAFPTLREDLEAVGLADAQFVPCVEIFETITTDAGTSTLHREFQKFQDKFLWKVELGLETALRLVAPHLGFEVTDDEITDLAEGRWKQDRREKLASIRDQPSNEERLLRALGEEKLRSRLPMGLADAVSEIHGLLTSADIARLLFVVHGEDTLHYLRDDLRAVGLQPPDTWAGRREARSFVRDLGFPDDFAGAPAVHREPELVVLGPTNLPPLHQYQAEIVDEIHGMIYGAEAHPRGMISLPTGAGKTRVAVQALIQALSSGKLASPVLWIAQSDELCEQAVQTWSEVWRAIGSTDELRIGRLWGPAREVPEAPNTAQVVVATIDKLRHRVDSADYSWLAEATCVVVDEAHSAITPEYTLVLRWLGISAAGRTMTTRAPLLGLTATPFRGTSRDETERLVRRFGGRRLDKVGADDGDYGGTYRELQRMGVLSKVDGEELETGSVIDMESDLSAEEKTSFAQRGDLPTRVFDKIARDVDRNRLLLQSILSLDSDWPVLLFAVSIEHAHTMAALLTLEGVSAAAIDYRTEPALRRRNVDRFGRGELRVLTNYNVLTQGFDAPAVRAIYVARPTFAPNNYQQMIGRGLRGKLNGGTERCLIVNVHDNWTIYGDKLAFHEFEHLWKPDVDV
jgi:superfamily II DNA or RNA helicase